MLISVADHYGIFSNTSLLQEPFSLAQQFSFYFSYSYSKPSPHIYQVQLQ
jgi:hypothetical protein